MKSSAEAVIIGGGCMGASLAWHLARRGLTDVVLLEREPALGAASTGRNAGGVRHQFSNEANIRLSIESIALFEQFEQEVGSPIDFHQHGYLFLLSSDASMEAFRRNVALQRALGVTVDVLTPHEARHLAPGLAIDGIVGATFCAKDGIADPNGVTMGFARGAVALGAEVVRECEVTAVRTSGGRVVGVATSRGPIDAPIVVDAAGAWAGQVAALAGLDVAVAPLRRHIFIAQPAEPGAWEHLEGRSDAPVPPNRIMVIDFETTFYFHREGAGLLFGMGDPAEASGFDTTVRWDFLPRVTEVAVSRLPALADASVSHAWAGLYEMTPDHNPIIGGSRDLAGFYVIAGFSGHGFQHSPAAGRILADIITGHDPQFDIAPFTLERFAAGAAGGEHYVV